MRCYINIFCVSVSNLSEESRQQSSELSEQLKLRVNENNALKQEVDELRKRLEMADDMLQQVRKHCTHLRPDLLNVANETAIP